MRRVKSWIGLGLTLWLSAGAALQLWGDAQAPEPADVLVVLGCRVDPGGVPSDCLEARTRAAVDLYEQGLAERVLFTGGVGENPPSEAQVAADLARELGLPEQAIGVEPDSHSTAGNAAGAAALLPPDARVILVSEGYHLLRARQVFGCHFEQVQVASAESPLLSRTRGALREVAAVSWHGLRGFCDS